MGAAAAAVVAGIILTPSDSVEIDAQISGALAAIWFVASTGVFLVASMMRIDELSGIARVARAVFAPWRMTAAPDDELPTAIERLSWQAKKMRARVALLMDIGMWLGGLGVIFLALTVAQLLVTSSQPMQTQVRLLDAGILVEGCNLTSIFDAEIVQSELNQAGPVRVELPPQLCDGEHVTAFFPRDSVLVTIETRD